MGFSMPYWNAVNKTALRILGRSMVLSLLVLLGVACSRATGESRIISATPNTALETLDLVLSLKLNETQLTALDNGIPLAFEFVIETPGTATQRNRIELSYQPMAKRYQLRTDTDTPRSFTSRLQLLAAMDLVRLPIAVAKSTSGSVQMRLDTGALPAPLRLPALLDRQWHLLTTPASWTAAS
jgi:hypothetical protein